MVGKADGGIDYQKHHFSAVDGAHCAHEAIVLDVLVDNALLAQARRVHDGVEAALMFHGCVDGIARGARHVRDDGAVVVGELVGKRRFARVRTTDDGNVDGVEVVLFPVVFRKQRDHFIEQVAGAGAVKGGNGTRLAQAQLHEFPHGNIVGGVVEFVHRKKNRLLATAEDVGHRLVVGVDAGLAVNQEDDDVGLVGSGKRLSGDGALEGIVAAHLDTTGIDDFEGTAVPVGFMIRTIARYAAHLVDNSFVIFRKAVHQGGFAHVRATNNGHDWQAHTCSLD